MILLGLTGSIGMGKSETAKMFRREGVPVFDADAAVHKLFAKDGAAVKPVGATFPGVVKDGVVDRKALGTKVFENEAALRKLESIVHPLVGRARLRFLKQHGARGTPMIVMDIPLLFETGGERNVDASVVVSAPAFLQRQRVLARPNMDEQRLADVLAQQMPDAQKCKRADFIVPSGLGKAPALQAVRRIIKIMSQRQGRVWPNRIRAG